MRDKNTPGTDVKEFVGNKKADAVIASLESTVDDLNDEILKAREDDFVVDLEINEDDLLEINVAENTGDDDEVKDDEVPTEDENTGD